MKIKTIAKEMKNADVRFISLVKRGANRLPFRIIKSAKDSDMLDLTTLRPVLKGEKIQGPAKKVYSPNFAQILGASASRDIGTPAPAIQVAPAKPVQSIAGTNPESTQAPASGGKPTRQAFNTPKEPLRAERGNPVEFKDLQAAIDSALNRQRDEEKARAFNESRSAFARLAPTRKSDVQGGGSGNAWGLRNIGGKLASAMLNSTARKGESALPTNTGFRAVSGATLKG